MIRSMTGFGAARLESGPGSLSIEIRGVNNRYLDLNLRLPEDLRFVEFRLRELIAQQIQRGKVEIRLSYAAAGASQAREIDAALLQRVAGQLRAARAVIPDTPAPPLSELLVGGECQAPDPAAWQPLCEQVLAQALAEFTAAREREGQRLAQAMLDTAQVIDAVLARTEAAVPTLVAEQQARMAQRLHDTLAAVSPEGFAQISGTELSARIAQESALFGLRVDVAEELARLRSHLAELRLILSDGPAPGPRQGSRGKRLDFLFQEMNREANTVGSKAGALSVTQAAIELKLLIEQLREQAQNIE